MEGFCWGVLAGAFLGSLALPVLAVRQGGLNFRASLCHPVMKTVLILALPLMLGQSIVALDEQLVRIFGSLTGEGGVSLLNYARRIMLVPVGVVAQAAGLASYPFLAALAASNDREAFDSTLNKAVSNTLLVALPLSLWMLVAAEPIMRLIFQQGSFTSEDAAASGLLLAIMLSGVAFWVVQQLIGRAFYACQDTLTPALAGSIATLLALPLYWAGARLFGAPGVAAAGTLGVVLYTVFLSRVWKRKHGPAGLRGLVRQAGAALLFCLPACAAAWGTGVLAGRFFAADSLWGAIVRITAGGLAFGAMYLGLTYRFSPALCAPITDFCGKGWTRVRGRRGM
jgi:putative peptidoglycan lipid II flippase